MLRKEQGQYQVETPACNSPLFCGDIEVEVVRNLPNEKRNGLGLSANILIYSLFQIDNNSIFPENKTPDDARYSGTGNRRDKPAVTRYVNSPEFIGCLVPKNHKLLFSSLCGCLRFGTLDFNYLAAVISAAGFTNAVRQFRTVALRTFDSCGRCDR
jgi:hypothetical protein